MLLQMRLWRNLLSYRCAMARATLKGYDPNEGEVTSIIIPANAALPEPTHPNELDLEHERMDEGNSTNAIPKPHRSPAGASKNEWI